MARMRKATGMSTLRERVSFPMDCSAFLSGRHGRWRRRDRPYGRRAKACASMSAPACGVCGDKEGGPLCNLYSVTKGQQAIRELAGAMRDRTGNLPPLPGIFPDYAAPIVRNHPDGRELSMARWGMPSPLFAERPELGSRRYQCAQRRFSSLAPLACDRTPLRGAVHELCRA